MNIFAKINNIPNITESEQIIIDFMSDHPIEFSKMTIDELADACYISKSSIYRFCNKLGYSGFNELKLVITASFSDKLMHDNYEVDFNFPFSKNDSDFTVLSQMRRLYEKTVYLATTHMDMVQLHYSISLLKQASNLIIFVDETNREVGEMFKKRMQRIGARIQLPETEDLKIAAAQNSQKTDVAIYVTYQTKRTAHQEIVKMLNGNQTRIILISPSDNQLLIDRSTTHLTIGKSEWDGPTVGSYSTNLMFMFVFDTLYSLYFNKDHEENVEKIQSLFMKRKNMH